MWNNVTIVKKEVMACAEYVRKQNLEPSAFSTPREFAQRIHSDAFADGIGCVRRSAGSCASVCSGDGPTRQTERCTQCVSDVNLCSVSLERPAPCCPLAALAMTCTRCIGRHGNDPTPCLQDPGEWEWWEVVLVVVLPTLLVVAIILFLLFKVGQWRDAKKRTSVTPGTVVAE